MTGAKSISIEYRMKKKLKIQAYINSDWAGDTLEKEH